MCEGFVTCQCTLSFVVVAVWLQLKPLVPYFGVLIIRILLFRVLYWGPLFSETPLSATQYPIFSFAVEASGLNPKKKP